MSVYDERIERAENILRSNPEYERQERREAIIDAMTDLMHLAKTFDLDPVDLARVARNHWWAER